MRRFVDLHLCPILQDPRHVSELLRQSSEFRYHLVGIPFSVKTKIDEILQVQKICSDYGLDLIKRADLFPRTPHELLKSLHRFRRKFEVISVTCLSKSVARQAAKDRRVDLLSFHRSGPKRTFLGHAEAELASKSLSSIEINMSAILRLKNYARIQLLSSLRKDVAIANKFHVPIVISSGETDPLLLRSPQEYASLASLFNIKPVTALDTVSKHPMTVVERNRRKLSSDYVAQGIRVVRRTA